MKVRIWVEANYDEVIDIPDEDVVFGGKPNEAILGDYVRDIADNHTESGFEIIGDIKIPPTEVAEG